MLYRYNRKLKRNAQKLRREMTEEERHLWYDFLKFLPYSVNRQKTIGDYIVDFYIAEKRTVIEIDGSQHSEPENMERDSQRDWSLRQLNLHVLRYQNAEIRKNFDGVCADILKQLGTTPEELLPRRRAY